MHQSEKSTMGVEEVVDLVSRTIYPLSEQSKKQLTNIGSIKVCGAKTYLVSEGQFTEMLYFLAKGSVRSFYLKDGEEISDWFSFENEFICAITAFHLGVASDHYLETMEPSVLLCLPKSKLDQLTASNIDLERFGRIAITQSLLEMKLRLTSLQFDSAKEKYQKLLQRHPQISLRIPLTHIASYLGISLETLSRLRNPKNI